MLYFESLEQKEVHRKHQMKLGWCLVYHENIIKLQ